MSTNRMSLSAGLADQAAYRAGRKEYPTGPNGRGLCRRCGQEVPPRRQTFCSKECVHEWRIRTDMGYVRMQVWKRDQGVCAKCGLDTLAHAAITLGEGWLRHKRQCGWRNTGKFWQADHIVPVVEGGGECGLENYRTLCTACHKHETAELRRRMRQRRIESKVLPLLQG